MKLYIHEGKGFYIGSIVIVYAKSRKTAEKLIREELDIQGLKQEELSVECIGELKVPSIIYSFNGDY